jgi:hypothetical protein
MRRLRNRPISRKRYHPQHSNPIDIHKDTKKTTIDLTNYICYFLLGCWLFYRIELLQGIMIRIIIHPDGVMMDILTTKQIPKNSPNVITSHLYKGSNWWNDAKILQATLSYSVSSNRQGSSKILSGRTFISYTSSLWETKWMSSIDEWVQQGTVCHQISYDTELLRLFWNTTCTSLAMDHNLHKNHRGWCILDDTHQPLFFHIPSGKISGSRPGPLAVVTFGLPQPVVVRDNITLSPQPWLSLSHNNTDTLVFSKFTYRLNTTGQIVHEYIEPLVGRLRHPMDCCEYAYKFGVNLKRSPPTCLMTKRLGISRTQYIPQYHINGFQKAHFFDSSCFHWKRARSTLSYVSQVWKRYGIEFDFYHIYEGKVSREKFMEQVPETEQSKIDYRPRECLNTTTRTRTTTTTTFTTDFIHEIVTQTSPDDYVLFHLNLQEDSIQELHILQEIIDNRNNILDYLDEFLYTIPLPSYNATDKEMSYQPWYTRFRQLRQRGIRAHAFTRDDNSIP